MRRLSLSISFLSIYVAVLIGFTQTAAAQSPWTLNRSGYYFQNTVLYQSTDQIYDATGDKQSIGSDETFKDLTNSLYLEYGIRDRLGLVFALPIKSLELESGTVNSSLVNTGFGDLVTGLRFRTIQYPVVASVQADVKVPTGYNTSITTPALGDGQTDYNLRLLVGRSFYPLPAYAQGSVGYTIRTENKSTGFDPANQIPYNLEVGVWFLQRALLIGRFQGNTRTGPGIPEEAQIGAGAVQFRVSDFVNLEAGVIHTFAGKNTNAGTQFGLAIALRGNDLGKYEGSLSSTLVPTERDREAVEKPSSMPPPPPSADDAESEMDEGTPDESDSEAESGSSDETP